MRGSDSEAGLWREEGLLQRNAANPTPSHSDHNQIRKRRLLILISNNRFVSKGHQGSRGFRTKRSRSSGMTDEGS